MQSYRDLVVWQKALDLLEQCYRLTRPFPAHERFGLSSQICRAATAIPPNIAEGRGRSGDFLYYLQIAHGSLKELETHVEVARRLGYLSSQDTEAVTAGRPRLAE